MKTIFRYVHKTPKVFNDFDLGVLHLQLSFSSL